MAKLSYTEKLIGSPDDMSKSVIGDIFNGLQISKLPMSDRACYTFRKHRRAVSWFCNFISTEMKALDEEFVSSEKYYKCYLAIDTRNRWLQCRFALMTRGLAGATEYSIEIRKVKEGFACEE